MDSEPSCVSLKLSSSSEPPSEPSDAPPVVSSVISSGVSPVGGITVSEPLVSLSSTAPGVVTSPGTFSCDTSVSVSSVDAPVSSADAPASSPGAPAPSAGAPAPSAGAPAPSAGAPAPSADVSLFVSVDSAAFVSDGFSSVFSASFVSDASDASITVSVEPSFSAACTYTTFASWK